MKASPRDPDVVEVFVRKDRQTNFNPDQQKLRKGASASAFPSRFSAIPEPGFSCSISSLPKDDWTIVRFRRWQQGFPETVYINM